MSLSEPPKKVGYSVFFLRISGPTLSPVNSLCFMCDLSQTGNCKKRNNNSVLGTQENGHILFRGSRESHMLLNIYTDWLRSTAY